MAFSLKDHVVQHAAQHRDRQDQACRVQLFANDHPDHARRKEDVDHHDGVVEPVIQHLLQTARIHGVDNLRQRLTLRVIVASYLTEPNGFIARFVELTEELLLVEFSKLMIAAQIR